MFIKKIVVAEDDDSVAHLVNMALGDSGYLCLRARNGVDALQMVRTHLPDLLLLDRNMPGKDGIEVLKSVKKDVLLSRVPILMFTAMSDVISKVEGLDAGADDYLTKPFDLRELAARVRALIRSTKREGDRNPITQLPGMGTVEKKISTILAEAGSSEAMYLSIRDFQDYVDREGYGKGSEVIAMCGNVVYSAMKAIMGEGGFVGHLGGEDFMVLVPHGKSREIFDNAATTFAGKRPVESIALIGAIVSLDDMNADDHQKIETRLTTAMRQARDEKGSCCIVWEEK